MQENRIKKVVAGGGVAVGLGLSEFGTRGMARVLEYANLDWASLDVRHSGYSIESVANILAWFRATEITLIVSPPNYLLQAIMDVGAIAVQVENVESAKDAQAIVDMVMYPPLGRRAINLNSPHTDYRRPDPVEFVRQRNQQISIVANIESEKGLNNVDEIAAIEGIDTIQPSRNDLTMSLGIPQQYQHTRYQDALKTVAEAAKRHGKMLKYQPHNADEAANLYSLGCRIMAIHNALVVFEEGIKREATVLRDGLKRAAGKAPQ